MPPAHPLVASLSRISSRSPAPIPPILARITTARPPARARLLRRTHSRAPLSTTAARTSSPSVPSHPTAPEANHVTPAKSLHTSAMASATTIYDFKVADKRGQDVNLADYKGKVVLVVNTASKCGFTPQYAGLEKLWKDIRAREGGDDFVILGFPCNQFGGQEPGSNDEIQEFCQINYGVTFPVLGKVDVNGDAASPLFEWLKREQPGVLGLKRVKWNFEKFLIGRDGKVKGRWASLTKPEQLEKPILDELEQKKADA